MSSSVARNALAVVVAFVGPLLYFTITDPAAPLSPNDPPSTPTATTPEVARLQAYLQTHTAHPEPDYASAIAVLNSTIATLLPNATVSVHTFVPSKPLLLLTLTGYDRSLPTVLLNSHTDVVPAEASKWTEADPFSAALKHGAVYARGAQDMKSVGMQYIEALAQLVSSGWRNRRTIHVAFVPDEEIGGYTGMSRLVSDDHDDPTLKFAQLNVGVALDEGEPSPTDNFQVFYGERSIHWVEVSVTGPPGHGATFPNVTANQALHSILGRALALRERELQRLHLRNDVRLGDVTSINVAYISAGTESGDGYAINVIPSSAKAGFDMRIPPTVSHEEMDAEMESWLDGCCDAGTGINASFNTVHSSRSQYVTSRDPEVNPFIVAFADGMREAGIVDNLEHGIFFASADGRYLREVGVPCFGFSPIRQTPNRMHKHDEFINVSTYLEGIDIYKSIIRHLADFESHETPSPSHSDQQGHDDL